MALTDVAVRNAKPMAKDYKLTDEKGLYLLVTTSGGRLWKLKFRNKVGVEKKLSLGSYPEVSLKQVRERRDEARSMLANGVDPAERGRAYAYVLSPQHYEMIVRMVCRKIDLEKHYEKNADIINARLLQELNAVAPEKAANLFSGFFAHDDLESEAAVQLAALDAIANEPDTPEELAEMIGWLHVSLKMAVDDRRNASAKILEAVSDDIRKMAIMWQENFERASSGLQLVEAIIAAADRDSPQKGGDCDSTELPDQPSEGPDRQGILP